MIELPGQIQQSELHVYSPKADQAHSLPRNIAWMNSLSSHLLDKHNLISGSHLASGIYHGILNFESNSDELIDAAQLLPYPSSSSEDGTPELPISIALTNFHFLLLYKDRLVGVCNLNEKTTYEEFLPLVRLGVFLESNSCLMSNRHPMKKSKD